MEVIHRVEVEWEEVVDDQRLTTDPYRQPPKHVTCGGLLMSVAYDQEHHTWFALVACDDNSFKHINALKLKRQAYQRPKPTTMPGPGER